MALTFGAATTDRVQIAAATSIDDRDPFTYALWLYPTTLTAQRRIFQKGVNGTGGYQLMYVNSSSGDVLFQVRRGGLNGPTQTNYITATGVLATNAWHFIAVSYSSAASPTTHIYKGTLTAAAAEVSYVTNTDGSGTPVDAQGANEPLAIGNRGANITTAFQGRIAWFGMWNVALSAGEIAQLQFNPHVISGDVVNMRLGFHETGTEPSQPDWSGNANAGSVTGATVGDHVPLGFPFGFQAGLPYVVAATSVKVPWPLLYASGGMN